MFVDSDNWLNDPDVRILSPSVKTTTGNMEKIQPEKLVTTQAQINHVTSQSNTALQYAQNSNPEVRDSGCFVVVDQAPASSRTNDVKQNGVVQMSPKLIDEFTALEVK